MFQTAAKTTQNKIKTRATRKHKQAKKESV